MAAIPRSEIERRATEVLRGASAFSFPVDVEKVAAHMGARLNYQPLEDEVSGVLAVRGNLRHIIVNSSHHPNRQRFSAAHELGHLALHDSKGDRLFVDTQLRVHKRVGVSTAAA